MDSHSLFLCFISPSSVKMGQSILLVSVFVLQYAAEHTYPQSQRYNDKLHEGKNILIGVFNMALFFFPATYIVAVINWNQSQQFGLLNLLHLPAIAGWCLTFLITDLYMYWWHRTNHLVPFFWRFHRFHHREEKMNSTTAFRFHTMELLLSFFFKGAFYTLLGVAYLPVLLYETVFFIVVMFHHSNTKISAAFDLRFRSLFSSPGMHRIHHSQLKNETDSNYGSVFSFWDKIFHSYKKAAEGEIVFGVKDEEIFAGKMERSQVN